MEFEMMKKIWDEQNQRHLYTIDEEQLKVRIKQKRVSTSRATSFIESIFIGANILAAGIVVSNQLFGKGQSFFPYIMSALFLSAALYTWIRRNHRLKNENLFDRSMKGDLDHAIANATYIIRLSYFGRIFFIVIGVFITFSFFYLEKPLWKIIPLMAFFVLVYFAARWEHRSIHHARKRRLEGIRQKLEELDV